MKKICTIVYLLTICVTINAQCIDFTDLRSSAVKCTYGTFDDPYARVGIIDDGPRAGSSRHTIHTDVNERDPRTNNQLRTVPQGEYASVRLGNWSTGAQAESITYEYFVNEEQNPILVFRYAAVMQDPDHTPAEQPRLTLEILDANNKMVDSYCGAFDFIASQSLGWNVNGNVLWKDWTAVGLDLSAYSGQTIYIRFTTYDCKQSGHYGYAYLNIACQQKKIQSLTCGYDNQTTLSGPDGFEYKWYTYDNGNKKFVGNTQNITVPTDETIYYCEVNQTGKPTCSFTLNAQANPRVPLANYSYQRKGTCVDTLYLTNLSGVSKDGQLLYEPHEDCDEYIWDLGDGRVIQSKDINQPIIYENTGTYKVKLTAKLINGNCIDVCERSILMHGFNDNHTKIIYDTICSSEFYMFDQEKLNKGGIYTHQIKTSYGCDSSTVLHLHVNQSYFYESVEDICDKATFDFHGRKLSQTGIYYDSLKTAAGCDSIYKLTLYVHPTFHSEKNVTICEGEVCNFFGRELTKSGTYYENYISSHGCDSVYQLNLTVTPSYEVLQSVAICEGENYTFRGKVLTEQGTYYDSLKTVNGCDSVIKLVLTINPTYLFEKDAEICENETYEFRGRTLNQSGTYYDNLQTGTGCDSVYKLNLTVHPTYFFHTVETTCDNHPYSYRGKLYDKSGVYFDSLSTVFGCDSVYRLDLTVYPTYSFEESATICDYETYKFQGKLFSETGIYKDTIPTVHGCDSVYTLHLRVRPTIKDTIDASVCLGEYYLFAGNMLYDDGLYLDTIQEPEGNGCEIHTLRLKTVASTIISTAHVDDACADDTTYQIKYQYTGPAPLTYSLYYDTHARMMGFKDVRDAPFTGYIYDTIPQFVDKIYLRPDIYNVRIEFDNGTCAPSQSAFDLAFMIKYPSWIIEQNWNDVVAVLNADYNGGYSFKQFDWFVNDMEYLHNTKSYIYTPQYMHNGDMVYAQLTRPEDDYAICTCPIVITDLSDTYKYDEPVLVSVNKVSRLLTVSVQKPVTYMIYNTNGDLMQSGYIRSQGENTITCPFSQNGLYIIVFKEGDKVNSSKFIL